MSKLAEPSDPTPPSGEPLLSHQLSNIPSETPVKGTPQWTVATKQWLIGDTSFLNFLLYLVTPLSLYAKNRTGHEVMRFRRDADFVPIVVLVILGLQHAIIALGTIVAVPMLLGIHYDRAFSLHAIQTAVIIAGISSLVNCIQIKIPRTPYQLGTGMSSFLGNSFLMLPPTVALIRTIAGLNFNPLTGDGPTEATEKNKEKEAYGQILGTAAVCTVAFILCSLIPRKNIKMAFPPVVTGLIITMLGLDVIKDSYVYWGGGQDCVTPFIELCNFNGNVRLPFGSAVYLGLGFLIIVLFLLIELFGSGFLRHNVILISGLIVYALAAIIKKDGEHYVTGDRIDEAAKVTFLWTETFQLGFHLDALLPFLFAYLVTYVHSTAVLTATVEESGIDIESEEADMRIQGGLIMTGLGSLFAVLGTGIPIAPIPQNNSVIYISRIASRYAGIAGAVWLIIFGIFGKVLAFIFFEIPIVVRGAVFTLTCIMIILTGLRILSRVKWDRRNTLLLLLALTIGMGNIILTDFIGDALWELGDNSIRFEESIRMAIIQTMEVPYFLGGVAAILLNFILPKDMELGYLDALPQVEEE